MESCDSLVIIPTYNEKENIEAIIRAIYTLPNYNFDILVIDDGSPDGTANIVKRLIKDEFADKLYIVERSGKLGLGTAYIAGFKWALQRKYQYIFEMDADFSHAPSDLPRLYDACAKRGADVSVGSRYVSGVNVVNWPMSRVLMSYFASKYVRAITRVNIHDTTAGFVTPKVKVAPSKDRSAGRSGTSVVSVTSGTLSVSTAGFSVSAIVVLSFAAQAASIAASNRRASVLFPIITVSFL